MVILLKIKGRGFFSTRQHSYFDITHCENSEVQIAVFSKWNMLREWKLVKRFTFCLPSTKCKWEFVKPRHLLKSLFDEVTVKTMYKNNVTNVSDIKSKTTRFSEMDLLKTINSYFLTEHREKGQIPTFSSPKITPEQVKVTQSKRKKGKREWLHS